MMANSPKTWCSTSKPLHRKDAKNAKVPTAFRFFSVSPCLRGGLFVLSLILCLLSLNPHALLAAEKQPVRVASAKVAATRTSAVPMTAVTDLKHWSNPDYTRIAVSLDQEA